MTDTMRTPSGAPSQAAREQHGGPGGKFPIFDHKSAHSALMLRGHAPNPAAIIARVRAWANANGDKAILAECDAATEADKKPSSRSDSAVPFIETRSVTLDNVDFPERIVTVVAVPYEQPTPVPYRQEVWNEVFARSAFNGIQERKVRIPVTACLKVPDVNHEAGRLVGRVVESFPNNEEGLVTDIKLSRTDVGTETLELARDGALSVSVGFYVKDHRSDEVLDRRSKTRRINRAFLDHLAFVAQPAYPGAKVLAMRSAPEDESPLPRTPHLDDWANDPIFQWAAERTQC